MTQKFTPFNPQGKLCQKKMPERSPASGASHWGRRIWQTEGKRSLHFRNKICLLGAQRVVSLSISLPRTTGPLWLNLPVVPAWRTGRACHLSRQRQAPEPREEKGAAPFPPLTWMDSRYRCSPATSETPAITPSGLGMLEVRKLSARLSIHTLGPLPSLSRFLSKSYFQLHHLLMPTDNDPAVYTLWAPYLCARPLLVPSAWTSLLTSSSWKDTYMVVNSSRKTTCCSGEESNFYSIWIGR